MQALLRKPAWRQTWRDTLRVFLSHPDLDAEQKLPARVQSFASSAQAELRRVEAPTIKSQLRLLYKRVHPDLFHAYPTERATNERSFKLLQEYLTVAQEGSHVPSRPFRFEFYLQSESSQPTDTKSPSSDLKKIELALPPPRQAFGSGGELSVSTKKALGKLLVACGLAADVSGAEDEVSVSGLGDLLRQAGEAARQQEADLMTSSRRIVIARNALRMGRGAKAILQGPMLRTSADTQADALEKLARALDLAQGVEVAGITFVVGGKNGLDAATGDVWLRWDESARQWGARIAAIDLAGVLTAKRGSLERQWKEAQVATVMGLEMVYSDHSLAPTEAYRDFLDRMESHGRAVGPVAHARSHELPLRVMRSGSEGASASFEVDQRMGFVSVPVEASAKEVWEYFDEHGQAALNVVEKFRSAEARLAEVTSHVRKKLRLRHLFYDNTISAEQYLQCCAKLLRHASTLMPLMDGLSLCIGNVDRLPQRREDPPVVHMRWNFSMNSM